MGTAGTAFAQTFRDFATEGVPASGPNKVSKSDARALGTMLDTLFLKPAEAVIHASEMGVVGDGTTDNSTALRAVIAAAARAGSTSGNAQFVEVILPAGTIRITESLLVGSSLTSVKFRLRGAGRDNTIILPDFFTTAAAPYFTVTGGGGSGAVLYPIIEFGQLKAVRVIAGGTGYGTAPTATLVATSGSGAAVTCTVTSGAVTSVAVNTEGTSYPNNFVGDALIVRGQQTEIADLTVSASATRKAATNGGTAAYPYFTTNNGIRYEPLSSYLETTQLNQLENVSVVDQPGHGINAARQENWAVDNVVASFNGSNGFFLHTQGGVAGSFGIANQINNLRCRSNGYRGVHVVGMVQCSLLEYAVFNNQTAGSLPAGVNEEILGDLCNALVLRGDVERSDGISVGKDLIKLGGCVSPVVSGYMRGGRYGVNCAANRTPVFQGLVHFGNAADVSNAILFFDSATGNDAQTAPIINGVFNLGNVNLTVNRDNASIYTNGVEQGVTRFNGMRGSQYATSQSTSYTPDYRAQGTDQTITLTGNVAFANPTLNQHRAKLNLTLVQDATGGRAPTFGTAYVGVGTLGSGTANQVGVLELECVVAAGRTLWVRKSWSGWL